MRHNLLHAFIGLWEGNLELFAHVFFQLLQCLGKSMSLLSSASTSSMAPFDEVLNVEPEINCLQETLVLSLQRPDLLQAHFVLFFHTGSRSS